MAIANYKNVHVGYRKLYRYLYRYQQNKSALESKRNSQSAACEFVNAINIQFPSLL